MRNWPFSSFYTYIYLLLCYCASICWQTRQVLHLQGGTIETTSGAKCPGLSLGVYTLVNSCRLSLVPHLGSHFSLPVLWSPLLLRDAKLLGHAKKGHSSFAG